MSFSNALTVSATCEAPSLALRIRTRSGRLKRSTHGMAVSVESASMKSRGVCRPLASRSPQPTRRDTRTHGSVVGIVAAFSQSIELAGHSHSVTPGTAVHMRRRSSVYAAPSPESVIRSQTTSVRSSTIAQNQSAIRLPSLIE